MSEARELSYYPIENPRSYERDNKVVKKTRKQNKQSNSGVKIMILFFPVILSIVCIIILFRYVNITSVRQEITSIENEIAYLEKNKMNLLGDLEGIKSSKKIAEDASLKLGMDYPTQDQIIYISVNENIPKEIPKSENKLKEILSLVGSMF